MDQKTNILLIVWVVCYLLFIACFVIFIAIVDGVDDPYPSLSDFHDYEPNLEFDDSDLLNTQHPEVEGMSWIKFDIK